MFPFPLERLTLSWSSVNFSFKNWPR